MNEKTKRQRWRKRKRRMNAVLRHFRELLAAKHPNDLSFFPNTGADAYASQNSCCFGF